MKRLFIAAQKLFAASLCALAATAGAQGVLENPVAGSTESGISIVSGWHCTAKEITVFVDGAPLGRSGVGSLRGDTAGICGHANTGFSLLFNYNMLTPGVHTISAYADGALLESRQFISTQSGGVPYLDGVSKDVLVSDFPQPGVTTRLRWSQAKQSFVAVGPIYQPMPAEGVWVGSATTASPLIGVFKESGEYWVIYLQGGYIRGVVHGNGVVSGSTFTSTNARDFMFARTAPITGSVTATITAGVRLNGSATFSTGSLLFDSYYAATYDSPPNRGALTGVWRGQAGSLGGVSNVDMQISADGSFFAAIPGGCAYTGTITPHASGRNLYDLYISTTTGCSFRASARGVAFFVGDQLIATGVLPDRSDAFVSIVWR